MSLNRNLNYLLGCYVISLKALYGKKKCFGAMSWLCINLSFFSVNALFYALAALLSICTSILILSPLLPSPCQPCNLTQHLKQKRDTLQQAKGLYHPPEWFWISACWDSISPLLFTSVTASFHLIFIYTGHCVPATI